MSGFVFKLIIFALIYLFIKRWFRISKMRRPNYSHNQQFSDSPYEILGLKPGATRKEIRQAYLTALQEYHPDKVMHLGGDLKDLAREKTEKIIAAYQALQ
jgi:DnaJ-class molecular chaperone